MKNKLREIRKARRLTQQQIADAIGEKVATYRTWERGTTNFNIVQLVDCARVLDCSTDEILGLEIRTDFTDPREAELHAVWKSLTPTGREHVLHHAKAESALEQGEAKSVERSNINTRRTA